MSDIKISFSKSNRDGGPFTDKFVLKYVCESSDLFRRTYERCRVYTKANEKKFIVTSDSAKNITGHFRIVVGPGMSLSDRTRFTVKSNISRGEVYFPSEDSLNSYVEKTLIGLKLMTYNMDSFINKRGLSKYVSV